MTDQMKSQSLNVSERLRAINSELNTLKISFETLRVKVRELTLLLASLMSPLPVTLTKTDEDYGGGYFTEVSYDDYDGRGRE